MNLKKIASLGLILTAISQSASAYYTPNQPDKGKGYYVYAGLGAAHLNEATISVPAAGVSDKESYNLGAFVTAGGGYKFSNSGFRAELEYGSRSNQISKTASFFTLVGKPKYTSQSFMANLLYEFRENKTFNPYVGFGVGYTFLRNAQDSSNGPAYQAIAGTLVKITDDIDLGLAYKYFSTLSDPVMVSSGTSIKFPYSAHSIEVRGILNF